VEATLSVLAAATAGVETAGTDERRSDAFKACRKGLGYCWSVAVAAAPEVGWPAFEAIVERAAGGGDRDLRWIARENLRKRRLERLDAGRVAALLASVGAAAAAVEAVPRDDPRREPGEERDEHG
jgi:hypothetical protein